MVDAVELLLDYAESDVGLSALAKGGMFGESLPIHVDPTDNPAIVFYGRGGNSHPEIPSWNKPRIQVVVYTGRGQWAEAKSLDAAVHDLLHGKDNVGGFKSCLCVVNGQSITDPDTGWATVVSFYEVTTQG